MAEKIIKWKSDDGHLYDTEIEAMKADTNFWKRKTQAFQAIEDRKPHQSSYGSSGGGGHD